MNTANISVPYHKSPPRSQPASMTEISIVPRTMPIGYSVALCMPVIQPSLGPGPRLQVRYNALPTPMSAVPARTLKTEFVEFSSLLSPN